MSNQEERDRLLQKDWRDKVIPRLGTESWITVYQRMDSGRDEYLNMYSGLVSESCIVPAKKTSGWNIYVDQIEPSLVERYDEVSGKRIRRFELFGTLYGILPFVFVRTFGGFAGEAFEILEEFRFFHRLYFDSETGHYVRFNETGTKEIVVQVSHEKVKVRRQEMRQFLAARRMYLMFFVIRAVYSDFPLEAIGDGEQSQEMESDDYHYKFWVKPNMRISPDEPPTTSKLHAKIYLRPGSIEDTRLYPFEDNHRKEYEKFILGLDADDREVVYTCEHDSLGPDYSDHTVRLPDYRIPVWFSSEVLGKKDNHHFNEGGRSGTFYMGEKATVGFSIPIPNYITVELGQLGRYLPFQEQSRWRSYNVSPIDDRWFRHSNIIEFHSNCIDFLRSYNNLQVAWRKTFDWNLFHPLVDDDKYVLEGLRQLIDNSYADIDSFSLSIAKLTTDSINDNELRSHIPNFNPKRDDESDKPKIQILQEFLKSTGYEDNGERIQFLTDVNMLRSRSAAHRKSSKANRYEKILERLYPDYRHFIQVADDIFTTLTDFLDSLRAHFCPDESD